MNLALALGQKLDSLPCAFTRSKIGETTLGEDNAFLSDAAVAKPVCLGVQASWRLQCLWG